MAMHHSYKVVSEGSIPSASTKHNISELNQGVRMDIGDVVKYLKYDSNMKFSRKGWNGKNQYISLQNPDENSKNTLPYIYMITVTGDRVPWLASQTDVLADDWFIYN